MKKIKLNIFCLFGLILINTNFLFAQVYLDNNILLSSTGDSAKVENLYTPNDSTAGLNVHSVQENHFIYAQATGVDSIILSLPVAPNNLINGMVFYFKAAAPNNDSVYLSLDNINYYPLLKKINKKLKSGDIKSNQVIATIFNGSNFQYLNYENSDCPDGFIKVTSEYCIEINERPVDPFYDAVVNCYDQNARLCNWGEWYYACSSLGASLNNMTNNWEYTDDAGNEVDMVRICGSGSCTAAGLQNIPLNLPKNYRCCYSLK